MKKAISILLALIMALSICACGKKTYFEQNSNIPMPNGLEIANTDETREEFTTYSFLLDADASEDEADKVLQDYITSVENEGIVVEKVDSNFGYTMKLENKLIGLINLAFTSDGYSLMVAIIAA